MATSWPRQDILQLVLVKKGPFSELGAAVAAPYNVVTEFGCKPGSTGSSTGLCQAFAPAAVVVSSTGSASAEIVDALDKLRGELPTPTGGHHIHTLAGANVRCEVSGTRNRGSWGSRGSWITRGNLALLSGQAGPTLGATGVTGATGATGAAGAE